MKRDVNIFVKRLLLLLCLSTLLFSPVLYFNLCIDPYGIFRSDFTKQRIEPNSHFIKLRHILFHPGEFDSFIFGTSRANNIDNLKIPDGHYFNHYYSLGLPKEHLKDLKAMVRHGVAIKNVMICFDQVTYTAGDWNRENDPLRKPYPSDKWELFKFYVNYIFQVPGKDFRKEIMKTEPNDIYKNILITGRAVNTKEEQFIESHKAEHAADHKFDNGSVVGYDNLVDQTIDDLKQIKQLCDEHHIRLRLVMNPAYKKTFLANNTDLHFYFLKRLTEISEFYDFGGVNRVTSNNYFYYEASHFRPVVGDAMINFIFRNQRIDSIPEFGTIVTKENVEAHIAKLKSQMH